MQIQMTRKLGTISISGKKERIKQKLYKERQRKKDIM